MRSNERKKTFQIGAIGAHESWNRARDACLFDASEQLRDARCAHGVERQRAGRRGCVPVDIDRHRRRVAAVATGAAGGGLRCVDLDRVPHGRAVADDSHAEAAVVQRRVLVEATARARLAHRPGRQRILAGPDGARDVRRRERVVRLGQVEEARRAEVTLLLFSERMT